MKALPRSPAQDQKVLWKQGEKKRGGELAPRSKTKTYGRSHRKVANVTWFRTMATFNSKLKKTEGRGGRFTPTIHTGKPATGRYQCARTEIRQRRKEQVGERGGKGVPGKKGEGKVGKQFSEQNFRL